MKIFYNIFNHDEEDSMNYVVKIGIVLFVSIIIYQKIPNNILETLKRNDYYNTYALASFLGSTTLFFLFLLLVSIKTTYIFKNSKLSSLIESLFLGIIIAVPMYLLHSSESEFKFIFLLVIISTVIKHGLRYGILAAFLSVALILGSDIINGYTIDGVNMYFEKDLIISGIYIFVAWILGYYVDIENEHKIKKENQLQQLNLKLEEQHNQRKNIELLLLKNEVCYDILFENSPSSIILHDNDKIIYANRSAANLIGYKEPTHLNNKSIYTYYPEEKILNTKLKYSNIIDNKLSKIIIEETVLDIKGNHIEVRNISSFFTYNGKPCILTFLFDMTTEKELEILKIDAENNLKLLNESREFNNLITEFFTNMSHELKTPVNVIYTAIQSINMYLEKYNDENICKCKDFLKTMKQNCFRIIRLVNNLLDITKVDCGFMKLDKKNDNIVSVVEDITQSVATFVKSKNLSIVFDTNDEERVMAFDHDKIERIMLNLLSNAYKYSNSDGEIRVNLKVKDKEVEIIVTDEGDGIPKEKLDIIFERFGQANRSLSRNREGSGIGLYLVKSFVEMHGGVITVNSIEGKGTEFKIVLPIELIEDEYCPDKGFLGNTKVEIINIEFSDVYSVSTCG